MSGVTSQATHPVAAVAVVGKPAVEVALADSMRVRGLAAAGLAAPVPLPG
ncbi:hypothetical protein [Novispirillum itersonii]|uniref:Uncharacterized protein n=1 Tax=Novispirillum itersonii TaxID=189 RepID=A0A7W9ZLP9_NOVIT|nr:hypothetical protein [Novispirillum itersonii]MBB6212514.1 hypothetical protein [Novispirillum itersonii]